MGTGRGIADITPLTLLDFPNKVACIFWLRGCNLFCQYCYNVSLVRGTDSPAGDRTDYLDFLRDRVGFLDGVVPEASARCVPTLSLSAAIYGSLASQSK